jgi:hypothetical protein
MGIVWVDSHGFKGTNRQEKRERGKELANKWNIM